MAGWMGERKGQECSPGDRKLLHRKRVGDKCDEASPSGTGSLQDACAAMGRCPGIAF